MIQRPRGTRDFSPQDMLIRRVVDDNFRKTALSYGYQEVATPTFENAELFIRKSGQDILDQLYLFRDKAERELVLRPELTAPVIRFYANELYKQPKPLKVCYFGNCFRYERPQKGRFREFWQFGAELIGTNKPEGIAELITFAVACLSNIGLKDFELRMGNINILKTIFTNWNISNEIQRKMFISIDKGDVDSLQIMFEDAGIENSDIYAFFNNVQSKHKSFEFESHFKLLAESFPIISEQLNRFGEIIKFIKQFNVNDFTIDLGIARGLDYYTGVVFEIDVNSLGAEKQVCGGGEYSLNELFNLRDVDCSGFAIGFDRVLLAYELEDLKIPQTTLDLFLIPLSKPGLNKAIEFTNQLRGVGFNVDLDIKGRNMSKNLKFASSRKTKFVVFLGDDELNNKSALVRDMISGEQVNVEFDRLIKYFQNIGDE